MNRYLEKIAKDLKPVTFEDLSPEDQKKFRRHAIGVGVGLVGAGTGGALVGAELGSGRSPLRNRSGKVGWG